jgi:hypothetical protein
MSDDAAFYEAHYSDWTVHELPLMVYVPLKDRDRDSALALVREALEAAGLDIRCRPIPPGRDRPIPPESCIAPPGNLCLDTGCWDADRCITNRVIPPG